MRTADGGPPAAVLALLPSAGLGGGIEAYADALLEQAENAGFDVHRCVLANAGQRRPRGPRNKLAFCVRAMAAGLALGRRRKVLVLALHPAFATLSLLVGVTLGRGQPRPRVFFHGWDAWTLRPLSAWLCGTGGIQLAGVSPFTAGALARLGPAAVLPPGIPARRYRALRKTPSRPFPATGELVNILSVFRLGQADTKGALVLLEAAQEARSQGIRLQVVVAGIGPPPDYLADAVERCREWATIVASPDEPALVELYAKCDLFVLATRVGRGTAASGEGFGIVLAEAALAGRPVVAPARGGSASAFLAGLTGLAPDDESPAALARVLTWAAAHPDRLTEMGSSGRAWAGAQFEPERYRRQVLALLGGDGLPQPLDLRIEAADSTPTAP